MHVALRHAGQSGVVAMALQAGLRAVRTPIEFPVIVMAHDARLEELQNTLSWKTLDRLRGPFDKLWGREFEALLEKAGKAAASAYSPGNFGTVQAAIAEVLDVLPTMYDRMYRQVGAVFADRAGNAARRLLGQDQRANVFEETADARLWVREQTGKHIKGVGASTVQAAKKFVDRSFTEGLTTAQIASGLSKHSAFSPHRAFRIARTEVAAASNAGSHFAAAAVLPKSRFVKVWLSSRDIRVRDTHRAGGGADGQEVDLDDSFKLRGGRLRFPGDSTLGAAASEIIHCRCTTTNKPKKGARRRPRQQVLPPPLQVVTPPVDPLVAIRPSAAMLKDVDTGFNVTEWLESAAKSRGMTVSEYKVFIESKVKKVLEKSSIHIRVHSKTVDDILVSKRLKSSFETGSGPQTSGPKFGLGARAKFEERAFSIGKNSRVNDRPIYGYLSDSADGNPVSSGGTNTLLNGYGKISFRLKKDVKRRATFSIEDSMIRDGVTAPSPIDNPSYRSLLHNDKNWTLADKAKTTDEMSMSFVETQVHGRVALSDVDMVFFEKESDLEKFAARFKELGIKTGVRDVPL